MRGHNTISTLFLLTIAFGAFGQKTHKTRQIQVYVSNNNKFLIDSTGYREPTTTDTLYYPDKSIQATGHVALEKDSAKSNLKVGTWTAHYPDGKIKSRGNYQIDSYIQCCYNGPCKIFRNYKTGNWTYYYNNGQIKATGVYTVKKEKIETSCKGGDKVMTARVNSSWVYFNENGDKIKVTDSMKAELEGIDH